MKVLIIGGDGMAGHMIKNYLYKKQDIDLYSTSRQGGYSDQTLALDVTNYQDVLKTIQTLQPSIVINAVGILNQYADMNRPDAIYINSLFPHQLKALGETFDFKLIHISTDCVFSGNKGNYTEQDEPDGTSMYARTKVLGEVTDNKNVTIRTSIIGPELKESGIGLFHWFINQNGPVVHGYKNVFWNGVTTLELSKCINTIMQSSVTGLIHLTAPTKISKFDLLNQLKDTFHKNIDIQPVEYPKSNKTLVNTREDFCYETPDYPHMLLELFNWMDKE